VKSLFRRLESSGEPAQGSGIIRVGELEINRSNYTVRLGRKDLFFPRKEFEVLALLAANRGKVFSREMLLNSIWGSDVIVVDRTVDVHIRKIREKLGQEGDYIETVKGVGYRFRQE
jgi:two-component system alkaline phosphatase synthesis response regulator PhoP